MTDPKFEVEGIDKLRKELRQFDGAIDDLKTAHSRAAKVVEREAERRVPVRTGALRSSVRSSGQAKTGVVRAGYARLPYAGVIHWGWPGHNIEANPYLYDALDAKEREVVKIYDQELGTLVQRYL